MSDVSVCSSLPRPPWSFEPGPSGALPRGVDGDVPATAPPPPPDWHEPLRTGASVLSHAIGMAIGAAKFGGAGLALCGPPCGLIGAATGAVVGDELTGWFEHTLDPSRPAPSLGLGTVAAGQALTSSAAGQLGAAAGLALAGPLGAVGVGAATTVLTGMAWQAATGRGVDPVRREVEFGAALLSQGVPVHAPLPVRMLFSAALGSAVPWAGWALSDGRESVAPPDTRWNDVMRDALHPASFRYAGLEPRPMRAPKASAGVPPAGDPVRTRAADRGVPAVVLHPKTHVAAAALVLATAAPADASEPPGRGVPGAGAVGASVASARTGAIAAARPLSDAKRLEPPPRAPGAASAVWTPPIGPVAEGTLGLQSALAEVDLAIRHGELAFPTRIGVQALADKYGLAAGSVRNALQGLIAQGVLASVRRGPIHVAADARARLPEVAPDLRLLRPAGIWRVAIGPVPEGTVANHSMLAEVHHAIVGGELTDRMLLDGEALTRKYDRPASYMTTALKPMVDAGVLKAGAGAGGFSMAPGGAARLTGSPPELREFRPRPQWICAPGLAPEDQRKNANILAEVTRALLDESAGAGMALGIDALHARHGRQAGDTSGTRQAIGPLVELGAIVATKRYGHLVAPDAPVRIVAQWLRERRASDVGTKDDLLRVDSIAAELGTRPQHVAKAFLQLADESPARPPGRGARPAEPVHAAPDEALPAGPAPLPVPVRPPRRAAPPERPAKAWTVFEEAAESNRWGWQVVAHDLLKRLAADTLKPDAPLFADVPERRYGVSTQVINKALDLLVSQGRVHRIRGQGTWVLPTGNRPISPEELDAVTRPRHRTPSVSGRVPSVLLASREQLDRARTVTLQRARHAGMTVPQLIATELLHEFTTGLRLPGSHLVRNELRNKYGVDSSTLDRALAPFVVTGRITRDRSCGTVLTAESDKRASARELQLIKRAGRRASKS